MNVINIAALDDDVKIMPLIVTSITAQFKAYGKAVKTSCYSKPSKLKAAVNERFFDIIFLDIDMPEIDGVSFAKALRRKGILSEIIFLSNREDKVFASFAVKPFGFVRKSNFLGDLADVVERYVKKCEENTHPLIFETRGVTTAVVPTDLSYVESLGRNQLIHVNGKKDPIEIHSRLELLEERLRSEGFVRIHKSFIVNNAYIYRINGDTVELSGGEKLPLSRKNAKAVRETYLEWLKANKSVFVKR